MAEASPQWSRATVILGTLTAFFACLAALGGAFGLSSSQAESDVSGQFDAAQRKAAADERTMESLRTTNNELQGQIDGLEAELDRLRESPPSAAPGPESQAAYKRYDLLDLCLDGRATVSKCTDPRVATVGDRQFTYINEGHQAGGDWREFITLPESDCKEIHVEFGSPDVDGLATGWTQVRLSTASGAPQSARAAEGQLGRLDVLNLTPGPISLQATTEYGNSTIGFNGWALCREGLNS